MPRTEHEQRAVDREVMEGIRKRARAARLDILRECPAGYAVDQPHAVALLTELGAVSKARLFQRTFLVRALVAHGWIAADVGAAFGLDVAQVQRELTREIWWRPSRLLIEQYSAEVRDALGELGVHAESAAG